MAPIAQNGPFWAQKWCFRPKINFSWTASKKIVTLMTGHLKDNLFVLTALQGGLRGGVGALFWAKKWPQNQFFVTLLPYNPPFLVSDGLDSTES